MNSFSDWLATTASGASIELLMWSWQAVALLAVVWLMLALYRVKSPALRHQIWLFGLIAVATLPLWTPLAEKFPALQQTKSTLNYVVEAPRLVVDATPRQELLTLAAGSPVESTTSGAEKSTKPFAIVVPLFVLWLIGVALALRRIAKSHIELQQALKLSRPADLAELDCADFEALSTHRVGIRLSPEVHSPALCGVFRATILLPADIADWTTPAERGAMIHHELAHIERWDPLINLFQNVLQVVFFFHPLVRYACRQLSLEREMACDDHVVATGAAAEAYAEGILKVAERSVAPNGVHQLALFSARQILERRIEMILNRDRVRVISRRWKYLIAPVGLIAVVAWLLIPVGARSASAGQQSKYDAFKVLVANPSEGDEGEMFKVLLVKHMGEIKAFDDLIQMALKNPDAELRRLAAIRLTELEGDGSTQAVTELYDKSNDPAVKRMMIDALGRMSEIEPLTKIAASDQSAEYRELALSRIKWLKENSNSEDIKAWDLSTVEEQLNKLPQQPLPPPPPPPPLTIPLPAEVTGLQRVAFLESPESKTSFSLNSSPPDADGNLTNVTVRIPGFTFKAAKAFAREGWIYLVDRFEVEHGGRTYYASGSMLIRTIPGGMVSDERETSIECWFSSRGAVYKDASREGEQISVSDLFSE